MKRLIGLGGVALMFGAPVRAEVEAEIPFGIEAVTGIRSDYVHRGFQLAESSLDFQLESELTLSDETSLHLGLSHLAESGGDFAETSGYLELTHSMSNAFVLGASMTYRDRRASLLDGGFDFGFFATLDLHEDWRWRNELNFDLGVDGIWYRSALEWSTVLTDDAFLVVEGGLSAVSGYLERDGINDFHTRISLTYTLSDQVSFTPFIGSSLQIDDSSASDILYGGLWFEVIF
jgi:hypothetical protein